MNECNSIQIDKTKLTHQTKYKLNKITKIKNILSKKQIKEKRALKY